jgi:hypothetical protein
MSDWTTGWEGARYGFRGSPCSGLDSHMAQSVCNGL